MRAALARVAERLGPPGGSERAAAAVLDAIEHPRDFRAAAAVSEGGGASGSGSRAAR
jgi:hypothetical protein